jgi:hypothetical protein
MPLEAGLRRASFVDYGNESSHELVRRRVLRALERRVLTPDTPELRDYFERAIGAMSSLYDHSADVDGVSRASDADLEQTALLLCHHDVDGDGLLSPAEFAAIVDLTSSQTGEAFDADHVAIVFRNADVDESGAIDLNELLLLRPTGPSS